MNKREFFTYNIDIFPVSTIKNQKEPLNSLSYRETWKDLILDYFDLHTNEMDWITEKFNTCWYCRNLLTTSNKLRLTWFHKVMRIRHSVTIKLEAIKKLHSIEIRYTLKKLKENWIFFRWSPSFNKYLILYYAVSHIN